MNDDLVVFRHPFTCIIAGPTQCGKTTLIKNILFQSNYIISPKSDRIVYCYNRYQEGYNNLKQLPIEFVQGLPDVDNINS